MIALLHVELRKLNGSLALLLAVLAPALPGLLALLSLLSSRRASQWQSIFIDFVLPLWSLFLLPMVVAAFATLVGQVEYRARGWDHMLALPIARWQLFLAKATIVLAGPAMMTLLVLLFTWVGASIGGHPPLGGLPWTKLMRMSPLLLASSTMLVMIRLSIALRFASFVMTLVVGIGGTLVAMAVAMTRTDHAAWFPCVLPLKILSEAEPASFALVGGTGGLVLLVVMVADLSSP